MATSLDKIHELVDQYTGPPPPGAGPAELAVRSMMMMGIVGPEMLPADAADLDGLLDYLAAQCLARRSDDADRAWMTYSALGLETEPADAEVIEG